MYVPHINLISKFPWKPPAAHQGAVEFWRSVRECSSRWIHRAKDADGKNMRRTYQGKPQSEIAANSCKFFILWAEWVRKNPLTLIHVDLDIYIYHFFGGDHSPHEQSRQAATRFPFRLGETCWNTANCKIHENTPSKQQSTGVTHALARVFLAAFAALASFSWIRTGYPWWRPMESSFTGLNESTSQQAGHDMTRCRIGWL